MKNEKHTRITSNLLTLNQYMGTNVSSDEISQKIPQSPKLGYTFFFSLFYNLSFYHEDKFYAERY